MIRSIGVIVPAHNEQDLLPSCLASLRRAARALRGVPVHLVVVADACRDQTAQVARRGGASVVRISAKSAGEARAAGARAVLRRSRHLRPADLWLATTGSRALRTRALPVITSARRESRAPDGFGGYLAQLDSATV